ncbi:hypothetical protein BRARA_B02357 [Brassica rapa]|uniref:Uncharacterized protein n=1 Tax=Brassica campestris TaxID=3711 RepID=A0A398AJA2_BRACM|nr:hypothetical protein BRARA_B02357 [Brassica rapa]
MASRHGTGKNVNQQNVNQRRSPDDAEREAREMVLSQILFSHSLERIAPVSLLEPLKSA